MLQTITQALQESSSGGLAIPLAFALGLVGALASICCTLSAMGMLVAYSGTRQNMTGRSALVSSIWFLIGWTFSIIYEALAGPFLDEMQGRLEERWFGHDPRATIERPTRLPAKLCARARPNA